MRSRTCQATGWSGRKGIEVGTSELSARGFADKPVINRGAAGEREARARVRGIVGVEGVDDVVGFAGKDSEDEDDDEDDNGGFVFGFEFV